MTAIVAPEEMTRRELDIKLGKAPLFTRRWATISACTKYRYVLGRELGRAKTRHGPKGLVILLNPSDADADRDDPTVTMLGKLATNWGWSMFEVVNCFAYRTPLPAVLLAMPGETDRVGPLNDTAIKAAFQRSTVRVVAWGSSFDFNHPRLPEAARGRDASVLAMLHEASADVFCMGQNADGGPIHTGARGRSKLRPDTPLRLYEPRSP